MLLEDEKYVVKWLSQYGALPTTQIIKMLRKKTGCCNEDNQKSEKAASGC